MASVYRVESLLPERVRISSLRLHTLELPKAQVEAYFLDYDGVRDVRYTPQTGTLTLRFTPGRFQVETLFELLASNDRASIRNKIAAFGTFEPRSNTLTRLFVLHSIVLGALLLRLPFGFYALSALMLGWPRLKNGVLSLRRNSMDEYLLESSALIAAVATRNPLSPLLLLWLDSFEALLYSKQLDRIPNALKPSAQADAHRLLNAPSVYERADNMVVPSFVFAGVSYGLSGRMERSAAILSINRHKGARMPIRLCLAADARTRERLEKQAVRFAEHNASAADLALFAAFTGLLPPTLSTLIARMTRIYTSRKLAGQAAALRLNQAQGE